MITNTLEDDKKFSFKVNGEWIEILKSEAPNMGVAYDLLAKMEEPKVEKAPAPAKKEKKQKKVEEPEVVEEKEE
tara:strand:+ start:252 stop:473 length:222 start_codon:yes stop_codon:yes gene_type:complete